MSVSSLYCPDCKGPESQASKHNSYVLIYACGRSELPNGDGGEWTIVVPCRKIADAEAFRYGAKTALEAARERFRSGYTNAVSVWEVCICLERWAADLDALLGKR